MALSEKFARKQLQRLKNITDSLSLEKARAAQDALGGIMAAARRKSLTQKRIVLGNFSAAFVYPKESVHDGVILYLHGGGYTCGDLEYAVGFGSVLASECGMPVFCPAYRLAPENKFPAAVNDCAEAYEYLLKNGYAADKIVLCGESAGGGLCYSLCIMLKKAGLPLPSGIIAISPWTDLRLSGASYVYNKDKDPSLTAEKLKYFADCYAMSEERDDPLISPLYGELSSMPKSLIFAGGDEIMLDDAVSINERLQSAGCESELCIKPDMWHAYVIYCLKEHGDDFVKIRAFLDTCVGKRRKLRWMRLDNAAKIYPAARNKSWTNMFRLSFDMDEDIDEEVLASATDITVRRFPSVAVRLRRGVFWYYLEELPSPPAFSKEESYPLRHMKKNELRKCAFRIIPFKNRIAVEFFHSLTDGTGGLIFIKSLVAEYVSQKYSVSVPCEHGILDRREEPKRAELEDSFLKNAGKVSADRREPTPFHISGVKEPDGFLNLTAFTLDSDQVRRKAKEYGVSVTALMCAVMTKAIIELQKKRVRSSRRQKPVKVLIPVNLRSIFPSNTLRNFAFYVSPEIDPRMGEYDMAELCATISHQLGAQLTKKQLQARFTTNVNSEKLFIVRIMPLFIKNIVMKIIFNLYGENKTCLSLSNLGVVEIPEEMKAHVVGMDFILGPQAHMPYNCGMLSYSGKMRLNFIRNTVEPELEAEFYAVLREMGFKCKVESNQKHS